MRRLSAVLLLLGLAACTRADPLDLGRLKLLPGFSISIFARVPHPRMMAFSPGGVLLATATTDGAVLAFPDPKHAGKAEKTATVLADLDAPHGIAFHKGKLYVAETDRLTRYDWDESQLRASNPQVVARLPGSGEHLTRSILFANGKLYVSVGSDCNVCAEKDPRRAAVLEFNEDGSGQRIFAHGLRNAVGLALNPKTGTVWVSDNGRDWLGDNLPPDEINDLGKDGGDYGWPYCYGGRTPDPAHQREGEARCPSTLPPKLLLQAHSAPLGIAFYEGTMFPGEYRGDLLVAFHGSWNRSVPTGYKVVRIHINEQGQAEGVEDFITGWLRPGETHKGVWMGRPAGVAQGPDGALYISDDSAGAIYRVTTQTGLSRVIGGGSQ